MSTEQTKRQEFQGIEAGFGYNRRKETDEKQAKALHLEDGYVSIQQRPDPFGETQVRHGAGYRKAAGDCRPCHRHVHSGAESP